MATTPENPFSINKQEQGDTDDSPITFEVGVPIVPEVGKEGKLASIESALLDIKHLEWAVSNLGEELDPSEKNIDLNAVQTYAAVTIRSLRSLGVSIDAVFHDLETVKVIKPKKV